MSTLPSSLKVFRDVAAVRVLSRATAPADLVPWIDDRRRLGVGISRIVASGAGGTIDIPLDHPLLTDGWWDVEWDRARL